jgi:hypothetical protein
MRRQTGSFIATNNCGDRYTIHVYADFTPAGTPEDPGAEVEGPGELFTSHGDIVTRIGPGEYHTLFGGRMYTDDPAAA